MNVRQVRAELRQVFALYGALPEEHRAHVDPTMLSPDKVYPPVGFGLAAAREPLRYLRSCGRRPRGPTTAARLAGLCEHSAARVMSGEKSRAAFLEGVRRSYSGLARGDRHAPFDLLELRQEFVYEGEKTILYAVFALLDWLEELEGARVDVREEMTGPDRLRVVLNVCGRGRDSRAEVAFCISHVWTICPDGRAHFQWLGHSSPKSDTRLPPTFPQGS